MFRLEMMTVYSGTCPYAIINFRTIICRVWCKYVDLKYCDKTLLLLLKIENNNKIGEIIKHIVINFEILF